MTHFLATHLPQILIDHGASGVQFTEQVVAKLHSLPEHALTCDENAIIAHWRTERVYLLAFFEYDEDDAQFSVQEFGGRGCELTEYATLERAMAKVRELISAAVTPIPDSVTWLDLAKTVAGTVFAVGVTGLVGYLLYGISRRSPSTMNLPRLHIRPDGTLDAPGWMVEPTE